MIRASWFLWSIKKFPSKHKVNNSLCISKICTFYSLFKNLAIFSRSVSTTLRSLDLNYKQLMELPINPLSKTKALAWLNLHGWILFIHNSFTIKEKPPHRWHQIRGGSSISPSTLICCCHKEQTQDLDSTYPPYGTLEISPEIMLK